MFYSDYFQFLSKDMLLFLRLSGGRRRVKINSQNIDAVDQSSEWSSCKLLLFVFLNIKFSQVSIVGFSTGVSPIKSGPQAVLGKELCWMETVYCSTAWCSSYCFSISRESWPDKFYDYTKRWQVSSSCMSFSFKCVTLLVSGAKPMGLILTFILFQAASSCW